MTEQTSADAVHPVSFDDYIISYLVEQVNVDLAMILRDNGVSETKESIMTIRGTMGVCEGNTKSATYGVNQKEDFLIDAMVVGLQAVDKGRTAVAYDEKARISGEWDDTTGGQLAWSE